MCCGGCHITAQGTGPFRGGAASASAHADFDQSYDPLNGFSYESTSSRYTVQSGDTLESVSARLWGDASFWYLIADANGLDGTETLAAGLSLIIPNKVHNAHNNAATWKVYDPNEAVGDTSPTAVKPPKKNGCGGFGQILLIAIAVAVSIIALPAAAPTIGQGILAGAAGSVASQGVGLATGIQDKFSFKGVALAAIGGGVGAGFGKAFEGLGSFGAAVARGALGSVITQGIGVTTGLQDKFDWVSVAASGVGAGVGNMIGGSAERLHLRRSGSQQNITGP